VVGEGVPSAVGMGGDGEDGSQANDTTLRVNIVADESVAV
jgi:hypothetical protein